MAAAPKIIASLDGADPLRLGDTVASLRAPACGGVSLSLCDGRLVPRLGASLETLGALPGATPLPVHALLLCEAPERWLPAIATLGVRRAAFALESEGHLHRVVHQARELGLEVGVSLFPATPLTKLDYLLKDLDYVVLFTDEPGAEPGRLRAASFDRVRILRENLRYYRLRTRLKVAGPMTVEDAARLLRMGADELRVDGPLLYGRGHATPGDAIEALQRKLTVSAKLV